MSLFVTQHHFILPGIICYDAAKFGEHQSSSDNLSAFYNGWNDVLLGFVVTPKKLKMTQYLRLPKVVQIIK